MHRTIGFALAGLVLTTAPALADEPRDSAARAVAGLRKAVQPRIRCQTGA